MIASVSPDGTVYTKELSGFSGEAWVLFPEKAHPFARRLRERLLVATWREGFRLFAPFDRLERAATFADEYAKVLARLLPDCRTQSVLELD